MKLGHATGCFGRVVFFQVFRALFGFCGQVVFNILQFVCGSLRLVGLACYVSLFKCFVVSLRLVGLACSFSIVVESFWFCPYFGGGLPKAVSCLQVHTKGCKDP